MQKLLPLSLESTPAAEVLPGTALAWHEVLVHGRQWEPERDRTRMRDAFRTLAGRHRRWPAPIDFLDALPRIETPKDHTPRIGSGVIHASAMKHISDIAAKLRIEPVTPHAEVDP
jgi:hypothetical protein